VAGEFKYRAFISYSRKDREFARRLQRELEAYVLPRAVDVSGIERKQGRTRPIKPVFRDESELIPGQDLPERIRRGLQESEFLIVVCSPHSARSEWVEKEIVDFTKLGKGSRILAVVVGGEPNAAAHGLAPELEALPAALRFKIGDSGEITREAAEPLWIDRRPGVADPRHMLLRIIGALLGLTSLDQLILRDRQAERRRRLAIQAVVSILALLSIGVAFSTYRLNEQRNATFLEHSRTLTGMADRELQSGNAAAAALIARQALPGDPDSDSRPSAPDAVAVLAEALQQDPLQAILVAREGTDDPERAVSSLAIGPDETRILTAFSDGTAQLWDFKTGLKLSAPLQLPATRIAAATFNPRTGEIVTASYDGIVRIWDATGAKIRRLLDPKLTGVAALRLMFDSTGSELAVSYSDGRVRLWKDSAPAIVLPVSTTQVNTFAFSPDGGKIVAGAQDGASAVYDAHTGTLISVLTAPEQTFGGERHGEIISAVFSPDGNQIALTAHDDTVHIFSRSARGTYEDSRELRSPGAHRYHQGIIWSVAYGPRGSRLAAGSNDGNVYLWDMASAEAAPRVLLGPSAYDNEVDAKIVAFSPDGQTVVAGFADDTIRAWDAATGKLLRVFSHEPVEVRSDTSGITAMAFAAHGAKLVTASTDMTVRVWAMTPALRWLNANTGPIWQVTFSPDGRQFATASADTTARIYDLPAANSTAINTEDIVMSVAFGRDLLAIGCDQACPVRLWDIRNNATIDLPDSPESVPAISISGDGKYLAAGSKHGFSVGDPGQVVVWDLARRTLLAPNSANKGGDPLITNTPPSFIAFSPRDDSLAVIREQGSDIRLVALPDRRLLATLNHSATVLALAYSRDGNSLVSGTEDGKAWVWDLRSRGLRCRTESLPAPVRAIAYDADRNLMAAGDDDGRVRLYDTATCAEVAALAGHDDRINALSFDPAAARLATASEDGTVRLWDVKTDSLIYEIRGPDAAHALAFGPSGNWLVAGFHATSDPLVLWNVWQPDGASTVHYADVAIARLLTPQEAARARVSRLASSPPDSGDPARYRDLARICEKPPFTAQKLERALLFRALETRAFEARGNFEDAELARYSRASLARNVSAEAAARAGEEVAHWQGEDNSMPSQACR